VGLVVSGGHTNLYDCASCLDWKYLGGTIDDAAGEAFDKVAVLLGLPFPGGPQLARLAQAGDPTAHDLPRPLLHDKSRLDFSFSGLKTAVRYLLFGTGRSTTTTRVWSQKEKADLAASFQQAVVDCLVGKAIQAVQQTGRKWLCVGGGVAANTALRAQLASACQHRDIQLAIADPSLCTDNAVMGGLAWHRVRKRNFDELDLDIHSGLMRSPDWL
jgi:N6-L-threonylcarbamoyladenine synthase